MELTLASAFTPGGLMGNLSYLLLIASMAMRNIFWLRVLAIFSGLTGIAYDVVWLHDPVGTFWESCFTLVNLLQWIWLIYEKRRRRLSSQQATLRDRVFPVLSDLDFLELLASADRQTFHCGETLIDKGREVARLFLIDNGQAAVILGEMEVSRCEPDDFVGEIGFFNRVKATATVAALTRLECLVFECTALRRMMDRNPRLERGLTVALNANLAAKLIRNNETGLTV